MPDWTGTFQNRALHDCLKRDQHCIDTTLGRLHMGGFVPPHMVGRQVQGDKALMGGLMRGT